MALFSSLGQGDVWSIAGISFGSPVNDILDKDNYTLEELLGETELIQEVKTGNQRLIQFLSHEDTIEKLVTYIVTPVPPNSDELRSFKYPYMSCEIFCCEIMSMLEVLVQTKHLNLLFSILQPQPTEAATESTELDHYLAGYFEKVLEMLFRRMTVQLMTYLNNGGIDLLKLFLDHIYNYSIMQIVQRVLLPHIPFNDIENLSSAEKLLHQCDWSYKKETCELLCESMLSPRTPDVPSHVSDMLITVLQLSPHESLFLMNIYNSDILNRLLETAFASEESSSVSSSGAPLFPEGVSFETKNNIILASISILESLISRLCETVNPFEFSNNDPSGNGAGASGGEPKTISNLQSTENIERITRSLIRFIPLLTKSLTSYLHPVQEVIPANEPIPPFDELTAEQQPNGPKLYSQTGKIYTKLSSKGLQLVRFVESLVRLANDEMDEALCVNDTLRVCIELMFSYELHSLLHLSVQRIVLILFEGGANEKTIRYLLVDCELINRIIKVVSEECGTSGSAQTIAGLRRPIVGHIITIGQSISTILNGTAETSDGTSSPTELSNQPMDSILRRVMLDTGLIEQWELFEKSELQTFLDKQVAISSASDTKGLEASPQSHAKLQLEMALEALSLNDGSANWPHASKLDDDDMLPSRHQDTLDLDDDDDEDDDNDYAIYHYNQQQQHRYGNSPHDDHDDFSNPPAASLNDATGFADFDNTPTFDAAFADFTTVPHDNNASDSAATATFDANFDNNIDAFASFPESNFADVDSWSTPSQSDDSNASSTANLTNTGGEDPFDPFGTSSSF